MTGFCEMAEKARQNFMMRQRRCDRFSLMRWQRRCGREGVTEFMMRRGRRDRLLFMGCCINNRCLILGEKDGY